MPREREKKPSMDDPACCRESNELARHLLSDDLVADDNGVLDLAPARAGRVEVRRADAAVLDLDVDVRLLPGLLVVCGGRRGSMSVSLAITEKQASRGAPLG